MRGACAAGTRAALSCSVLLCFVFGSVFGCAAPAEPAAHEGSRDESARELAIGALYLHDATFRRATLERSLAVRDNTYATKRLASYARPDEQGERGEWDGLPEHNPPVRVPGERSPVAVWDGTTPDTRSAWLELGRRAFELYPAQRRPELSAAFEDEAFATRARLWRAADGRIGGIVLATFADGSEQAAVTCSTCHARTDERGELVPGAASDVGDSGALPGLVDVTADDSVNPVAIADLRATRKQRRLHATGNVFNDLATLTVRIETLLITSNAERVRPPRELAFALALYVWSLGEPAAPSDHDELTAHALAGQQVFEATCVECHEGALGEGDVVASADIDADDAVARSGERGDPMHPVYRVPSLFRVAQRTRLMHDGSITDLDALLSPDRAQDLPAHPFGLELGTRDRNALLAYLESL